MIGQQHIGLLEQFADRGGAYSTAQVRAALRVGNRGCYRDTYTLRLLGLHIIGAGRAAGEDIDIRHELALHNAAYHKDLYSLAHAIIAQHHYRRGQTWLNCHTAYLHSSLRKINHHSTARRNTPPQPYIL